MIEHEGIVEQIEGNHITVRILQQSACSECHAKGVCLASDSKEKRIDVRDNSGQFHINERVILEGKGSMGLKAVLWAFVVPLIILVTIITLAVSVWHFSEPEAAATSIVALIPYGFILYALRKKMADSFKFTIKKNN